jgi:hypothetical protein
MSEDNKALIARLRAADARVKEPGQLAYDAFWNNDGSWEQEELDARAVFARVEAAVRADERDNVIEECAKIIEAEKLEEAPDNDSDRAYDAAIEHAAAAIRAAKEPE